MSKMRIRPSDLEAAKLAEGVYDRAEAALVRASEVRAAVQRRIDEGRLDLAALDARILELVPDDVKPLMKLDGERTGVRVGLEILERKSLPEAEAGVVEALAAVDAAEKGRDAAVAEVGYQKFVGVEGQIVELVSKTEGEVRQLLLQAQGTASSIRGLGYEEPRSYFLRAAGYVQAGGSRADLWREIGRALDGLAAVQREVEADAWLHQERASRGIRQPEEFPTPHEYTEYRRKLDERRRVETAELNRKPEPRLPEPRLPEPRPSPGPTAEANWAQKNAPKEE